MPLGRARVHRDELLGISSRTHAAGGASRPAAPQRETPFTQRHASLCISHKIRAVRVSGGEDCSRRRQVWVREGETCSRWATEACRARKTETHQAGRRCAPPTRMCVWWGCFRRNRRAEVFWTLRLRRQNHIAQGGVAAFFNQCTHMTAEGDFTATDGQRYLDATPSEAKQYCAGCRCGAPSTSAHMASKRDFTATDGPFGGPSLLQRHNYGVQALGERQRSERRASATASARAAWPSGPRCTPSMGSGAA